MVAINDVYELANLPKLQTFLSKLSPPPSAVVLAGDFLSPSLLSSFDGGMGMIATLRAVGLTHITMGNHEADLRLDSLHQCIQKLSRASVTILNSNMRHPPPKSTWLKESTSAYDIVKSQCGKVNVVLAGIISDEKTMFRDGTFKGVSIDNMTQTFDNIHRELIPSSADFLIPVTHASFKRDLDVALHMTRNGSGVLVGGHDHEPVDETVEQNGASVRILKAGTDARTASLIDLHFDTSNRPAKLVEVEYSLVNLLQYDDSLVVKKIVDSKMQVLREIENETIVDCNKMLPPGQMLSSERSRYNQTTLGAFVCQAIKEELETNVAVVNGAAIKGGTVYENNKVSYAELRKELPFPTKMVVVKMTRSELEDAIHYSRSYTEEGDPVREGEDVPRRGYLQVDWDYDSSIPYNGNQNDELEVALPRNLLAGFCQIKPLVRVGDRLKKDNLYPTGDDFVPAMDLVVRHCSKHRWSDILQGAPRFEELDLNHDGVLDRHEIKLMMKDLVGKEPPDFVIDDMINSIDADENGVIDAGEFSYLVATAERDQRW